MPLTLFNSQLAMTQTTRTGAEAVRWDLTDIYANAADPRIDEDLKTLVQMAKQFEARHRGSLATTLGDALVLDAEIDCLSSRLLVFLFLTSSLDAGDQLVQKRLGQVQETWSRASADHMNFFDHELVAIPEDVYAGLVAGDERVAHHKPTLDHMRANRAFLLAEEVERALTLRAPFGPSEWSNYMDEAASELRFDFENKPQTLTEILHCISSGKDGERRAAALECLSRTLSSSQYDKLMARILNVILGAKGTEDGERGYPSPMSARNISNQVDDATVEALHAAVATEGAAAAKRYYRLLSAHLGKSPLRWSDRLADLPFADDRVVTWDECVETVLNAYGSFSPTLRALVEGMLEKNWIDAPPAAKKRGGAFNYSIVMPGGESRSYNLLNFQGTVKDVMTMAHEAGHGVHGMLAGEAQGVLQFRAPTAYAETASIFGEMTTFQYLLAKTETDEQRLALLMNKCADHLGSVVRQISMSNFERSIHGQRAQGKLTVEDYNAAWMKATADFFGKEGELFTYENADNMWSYVSHFTRPFYVYSYAFGELFTQGLFAVKDSFGDKFEGMYLDLLRAGGSKSAVELMQPFGLDPRDPDFWTRGIRGSIHTWLDEAETISKRMGV